MPSPPHTALTWHLLWWLPNSEHLRVTWGAQLPSTPIKSEWLGDGTKLIRMTWVCFQDQLVLWCCSLGALTWERENTSYRKHKVRHVLKTNNTTNKKQQTKCPKDFFEWNGTLFFFKNIFWFKIFCLCLHLEELRLGAAYHFITLQVTEDHDSNQSLHGADHRARTAGKCPWATGGCPEG